MNLLYFTSGHSLQDGEIRRQLLRIPEVLQVLRMAQAKHESWDLIASLLLDEEYARLSLEQREELIQIVQHALFERFTKTRIPFADLIRRSTFVSPAAVAREFAWRLEKEPTLARLTVYVIGPGLDEVPMLLKDPRVEFIDLIDDDPALQWFWPELTRAADA
jgi:hypothetical protein